MSTLDEFPVLRTEPLTLGVNEYGTPDDVDPDWHPCEIHYEQWQHFDDMFNCYGDWRCDECGPCRHRECQ